MHLRDNGEGVPMIFYSVSMSGLGITLITEKTLKTKKNYTNFSMLLKTLTCLEAQLAVGSGGC